MAEYLSDRKSDKEWDNSSLENLVPPDNDSYLTFHHRKPAPRTQAEARERITLYCVEGVRYDFVGP